MYSSKEASLLTDIKTNPNKGAALKELANLMRDDFQLVDWFREAGACEWVVQTMSTFCATNARVAESGCASVLWMAFQNSATSERLGKCGACEAIVEAMKQYGETNALVARFGSNAIGNLTADVDENAARFGKLGICTMLVKLLQIHGKRDPYVAENICYAVGNLVAVNEANRKMLSVESGICEAIVDSLRAFADFDPVVANFACNAIGNLALTCGAKLGECGACETVVGCLERFRMQQQANSHVALSGCYAIGNLAFDSAANKIKLREHGACKQVVRCLVDSTDEDIINNAYYAIKRLAFNNTLNQDELTNEGAWEHLTFKMGTIKLSSAELNSTHVQALFKALRDPRNKLTTLELHAFQFDDRAANELIDSLQHANNRLEQLEMRNVHMPDQCWTKLFKTFENANNRVAKLSTGNSRADVDFVNLQFIEYFLALQMGLPVPLTVPHRYPKDGKFEFAKCLRELTPVCRDFVLKTCGRFAVRHHTFRTLVQDLIKLKCDSLQSFARLETLSIAKLQIARELSCMVHVVSGLESEDSQQLCNKLKTSQGAMLVANLRKLLAKSQQEEQAYMLKLTKEIDTMFSTCEVRFDDGLLLSMLTHIKLKISKVPLSAISKVADCLNQVQIRIRTNGYVPSDSFAEMAATVEKIQQIETATTSNKEEEDLLTKLLALTKKSKLESPAADDPYFELKMGISKNFEQLQICAKELADNQARDLCSFLEAQAALVHQPFAFMNQICRQIDKFHTEFSALVAEQQERVENQHPSTV